MSGRGTGWFRWRCVTLREQSTHGYELMERLRRFGFERISPGTLYRTLRKMEREGLCYSEWQTSEAGPACRVYSITGAGEAYLESWARASERYQRVLDAFSLAYAARMRGTPTPGWRA